MTIVVDASALVAIALDEPEAEAMMAALDGVQGWATPVNTMEAGLTLVLREGLFTPAQFQDWLADRNVAETHSVTSGHALAAYLLREAFVDVVDQALAAEKFQPLVDIAHAPALAAGEDKTGDAVLDAVGVHVTTVGLTDFTKRCLPVNSR